MAVATFSSVPGCVDVRKDSQLLATKYFFSQFWCEFTSEVLIEFFHEDVIYRQQETEAFMKKAQAKNMGQAERKKHMLKILENKSSVFQKDEITKRNFYL